MYFSLLCSVFHTVIDFSVVIHICLQFPGLKRKLVMGVASNFTVDSLAPVVCRLKVIKQFKINVKTGSIHNLQVAFIISPNTAVYVNLWKLHDCDTVCPKAKLWSKQDVFVKHICPAATKFKMAIFSIKVTVKVTRSLTLVSIEVCMPNI